MDGGVGVLAAHAGLGQRQQHALRVDEPAERIEVLTHPLGIDDEPVDQPGQPRQREIERDRRVGGDHPLDRGVRDVALVPQRHILERRHHGRADQPGEPGQILGEHRVALVRHRRGALLAGREIFLGLAQLGALQVADLGRQTLDRGADQRQGHEELRVTVARDHLGRDRLGLEAELLGDMGLDRRIDIGEGPDGTRDLAGRHLLARGDEAGPVAGKLGVVSGELEAEGRRLGMDAVAAPDRRRVFVLERAPLQRREQRVEIGEQDVGGLGQLHRQASVEHIAGGHSLVHKTRLGADMLGEVGQKGDHVVVRLALDLVDPLDLERAALPHRTRRTLRDHAERRLGFARACFDLEPDPKPVFRGPDPGHFGSAVAWDHSVSASSQPSFRSAATICGGTGAVISSGGRAA